MIHEWSKRNEAKHKTPIEQECLTCSGTGTVEDNSNRYGVRVCKSCNGHGVVLFDGVCVHGYEPQKDTKRVMGVLSDARK